jgi:hypothetical protein
MPHPFFTAARWQELQRIDAEVIALTKENGIDRWAPHVGDVRRASLTLAQRLSPATRAKFFSSLNAIQLSLRSIVHEG